MDKLALWSMEFCFGIFMPGTFIGFILWSIYNQWFRGIDLGRLDKPNWTKRDYQKWLVQEYSDMFPLSKREEKIKYIIQEYHS